MSKPATAKKNRNAANDDHYLDLVREVPLRPIRSDIELDRAIAMIDSLIDKEALSPEENDYLDVLSVLVEKYETEIHPMPSVTDAEMLRHLIESRETTQSEVSSATGVAESTISELLVGKRKLNRKHIESFAKHFRVNPGVFLQI